MAIKINPTIERTRPALGMSSSALRPPANKIPQLIHDTMHILGYQYDQF